MSIFSAEGGIFPDFWTGFFTQLKKIVFLFFATLEYTLLHIIDRSFTQPNISPSSSID